MANFDYHTEQDTEDVAVLYGRIGRKWRENKDICALAREFETTPKVIDQAVEYHLNLYPEEK